MLTIHHLGISQSERIIWLCEEYGVPYDLKLYARDPQTRLAPAAYKALHPAGTAPVITDGDITLGETGAIFEYILTKYAPGQGVLTPDHPDYADYLYWYHFVNGSFTPAGMTVMIMDILGEAVPDALKSSLGGRFTNGFDMIEKRLSDVTWLAGDEFTAADIMMGFSLSTARAFFPKDLTPFPAIRAYLKRIGERPAYQRAMAKGEPDLTPMLE